MYPKVYAELSQQSRDLDMLLYNTISTIVTGNMLKVISDLRGDNARYTFAIIAMWKHANLAAANRRLLAMNTMSSLQFHGDAGKWKIEFNDRVREVLRASTPSTLATGRILASFMRRSSASSLWSSTSSSE